MKRLIGLLAAMVIFLFGTLDRGMGNVGPWAYKQRLRTNVHVQYFGL
jgi:hypothetical protein